jgi:hypothetical protein
MLKNIQFSFKGIIPNNQRGIYLIDFNAEGISSRAIIKKGSIICLK